ncbi:hypothetical protein RJ639_019414 [Escallonia herrerae]|uniref:Reverse transcriptase/retrotransposon-derived protein RNase H-like domain-containing protein n=1 Tax=Escallonia herrerae TaxID=1293975 RepID=A0AA88V6X2_9ASTE|nr:hypothetical protein RJ639_019414 [Escallonia herrerae]
MGSPMMNGITQGPRGKRKALMKLILPRRTLIIILVNIVPNDIPVPRSLLGGHSLKRLIAFLHHRASRCLPVNRMMAQETRWNIWLSFTSGMNLHLVPDQIMCRAFPVTLKGAAHVSFQHLTPRSISCWAQLAKSYRSNFLTSRIQRKNSSALFRIVQGPKESLKFYYARFNTEKLLIDNLDAGVTFAAMARGVKLGTPLRFSLNKRPPKNMTDLLDGVEKYLRDEEDSMTTQDEGTSGQQRRDRPEGRIPKEPKRSQATLYKHLTPLTTSQEHILNQIKSQNILKWPKPMRMLADKRDAQLYCHFHKDHGHKTEECKVLQRETENLIEKGHLKVEEALVIEDQRAEQALKNIKNFEWTAECRASFEALKNYLSAPPLFSKPLVGDELFLYLAIADSPVSAVLVREQDGNQLPIYYVRKVLQGAEMRDPDTEKLIFALLVATRKLQPYFQSHSIMVLMDIPLRRILYKPDV